MKYVCENTDCSKYGIEEYYVSETFKYQDGRLVGSHAVCPSCGKERKSGNQQQHPGYCPGRTGPCGSGCHYY